MVGSGHMQAQGERGSDRTKGKERVVGWGGSGGDCVRSCVANAKWERAVRSGRGAWLLDASDGHG